MHTARSPRAFVITCNDGILPGEKQGSSGNSHAHSSGTGKKQVSEAKPTGKPRCQDLSLKARTRRNTESTKTATVLG